MKYLKTRNKIDLRSGNVILKRIFILHKYNYRYFLIIKKGKMHWKDKHTLVEPHKNFGYFWKWRCSIFPNLVCVLVFNNSIQLSNLVPCFFCGPLLVVRVNAEIHARPFRKYLYGALSVVGGLSKANFASTFTHLPHFVIFYTLLFSYI